nr:Chain C, p99p [Mus]
YEHDFHHIREKGNHWKNFLAVM